MLFFNYPCLDVHAFNLHRLINISGKNKLQKSLQELALPEHPVSSGRNLNAENWWWMTEDDDLSRPDVQGLSIGVINAWNYLKYQGLPPTSGTWRPSILAIIDGGFDLDENNGVPKLNNTDYFFLGNKPLQADYLDFDGIAGGSNPNTCSGGGMCPWHGQGSFGVSRARPRNLFGSAGTGGEVVRPMLLKIDGSFYTGMEFCIISCKGY